MATLPEDNRRGETWDTESPEDLRRLLIEDAEDYLRRHPTPPMEEVVDEIVRHSFRPADFGLPDSTTMLRRERER